MTGAAPETSSEQILTAAAEHGDTGRLDAFLAARLPLSRSRIKALIGAGAVSTDGETILDPSRTVKPGTLYRVAVPPAKPAEPEGQDIALDVLYEDEDVIVIDKPAGLVVHPAPGNSDRTLVNALIHHCGAGLTGIGGIRRPGIVHRLDKDTSGVMVVAKTAEAHESLVAQFSARTIERLYGALVWGMPSPREGRIEGNIGRSPRNRKKMAVLRSGGRAAATRYRVIATLGSREPPLAARIECRLETGRTHQIRVHMAHIGHPVVGDQTYGSQRRFPRKHSAPVRQALHAFRLGFRHPRTGELLRFDAPFPYDFKELERILEDM